MALSVSDVVNVSVNFSPVAAAVRNFGALLIAGASDVIPIASRIRRYSSATAVAADFGTLAPEYSAANLFFSQSPKPRLLFIGRWAQSATKGVLTAGVISPSAQAALLTTMQAITSGSFTISLAGTVRTFSSLNFSSDTSLTQVAARINTAMSGSSYGTCLWDANNNQFVFRTNGTGVSNGAIGYGVAGGGGTDITAPLKMTQALGASLSQGVAAETPVACATAMASISNDWYGLMFAVSAESDISPSSHIAVSAYIEAAAPARVYGINTTDANCLVSSDTTNVAYLAKNANYMRTFVQYSSSSLWAVASLYGRAFTVDFTANNTAITLKFKTEPGVTAETLTETQAAALDAFNCNVFVNYDNSTAIIQQGEMSNGYFIDEVTGLDWLSNTIQTNVYNVLYTALTKVPQTDAGVHLLANAVSAGCDQGVNNGLIAPGQWNGPPIGPIATGDYLGNGYFIYVIPIAEQAQSVREQRIAPTIQALVKLAGAVHFAAVIVNVNR